MTIEYKDSKRIVGLSKSTTVANTKSISSQTTNVIDLAVKPDGTEIYVATEDTGKVITYELATAGDVSTAVYNSSKDYTHSLTNPKGMDWNNDGTKIYLASFNSEAVHTYTVSPAYDLSSTVTSVATNDLSGIDGAQALQWSHDGAYLFQADNSGVIHRYEVATAFVVSDGTRTSFNPSETTAVTGISFGDNGKEMYIVSHANTGLFKYTLSPAYDLSTATHDSTLTTTDADNQGIATSNGKIYVLGQTTDIVTDYNNDIKPTNVQDNSLLVEKDVSRRYWFSEEGTTVDFPPTTTVVTKSTISSPDDMIMSSDGLKILVVDYNLVNCYTLSTAWDLSTMNTTVTSSKSVSYNDGVSGININNDGSKIYVLDYIARTLHELDLTTNYDLSTASDNGVSKSVGGNVPTGLAFSTDGLKLYVADINPDQLRQYSLSTAWDLSTMNTTAVATKSLGAINAEGMAMNNTGTKIWVMGSADDTVREWTLSTAWDLSTATEGSTWDNSGVDTRLCGGDTDTDDTKLFFVGSQNGKFYEYPPTPATWTRQLPTLPTISDLVLHLDANASSTITKDSSNLVATWGDGSSASNDITASGTARPTWVDDTQTGLPVIRFDGSNNVMTGTTSSYSLPNTLFMVCTTPNADSEAMFDGDTSRNLFNRQGTNTYRIYAGAGVTGGTANTAMQVFTVVFNNGSPALNINGSAQSLSGTNIGTSALDDIVLGAFDGGSGKADYDVCEVLFYNKALSTSEISSVESYLNKKWGVY